MVAYMGIYSTVLKQGTLDTVLNIRLRKRLELVGGTNFY